jgi:hypothetical protein
MFAPMIRIKTRLTPVVIVLFASITWSWADVDTSRFSEIVDRNPFRLKDPPPPVSTEQQVPLPPPAPLATVDLTGITGPGILPTKTVLLEIIPGPGKPMIKPPPLKEGEKIETVEVVSIDVEKNEVIIKNGNLVTNLTFKVAKSQPTPPPAGAAGTPGMQGRSIVPPTIPGTPQANAGQTPYNYSQGSGGRSGVIMTGGATPTYQDPGTAAGIQPGGTVGTPVQNNNFNQSPFRSIPSRSIRTPGVPQPNMQQQQQPTAEVNVIEVEQNSRQNPHLPFPPTVLNPQFPPFPGQTQPK